MRDENSSGRLAELTPSPSLLPHLPRLLFWISAGHHADDHFISRRRRRRRRRCRRARFDGSRFREAALTSINCRDNHDEGAALFIMTRSLSLLLSQILPLSEPSCR